MKRRPLWRILLGSVILSATLLGAQPITSCGAPAAPAENLTAVWDASEEPGQEGMSAGEAIIAGMLGDIHLPGQTRDLFVELYTRHEEEIHRIIVEHPDIIVEALDVTVTALPALRAASQNGGKLYLSRNTYSRADGLLSRVEALAGPELALGLRSAKTFTERRTTQVDPDTVCIDLFR